MPTGGKLESGDVLKSQPPEMAEHYSTDIFARCNENIPHFTPLPPPTRKVFREKNQLSESVIQDMAADWAIGGPETIAHVRTTHPLIPR
jgi:hypothetical protein